MASADNFAIEKGKSAAAVKWIEEFLARDGKKLKITVSEHSLQTLNFGSFDLVNWSGDWSVARNVIKKVSSKLNIKVIESGYHKKGNIVSSFFGINKEYGKVYSGGKLRGTIVFAKKSGRWVVESEKRM